MNLFILCYILVRYLVNGDPNALPYELAMTMEIYDVLSKDQRDDYFKTTYGYVSGMGKVKFANALLNTHMKEYNYTSGEPKKKSEYKASKNKYNPDTFLKYTLSLSKNNMLTNMFTIDRNSVRKSNKVYSNIYEQIQPTRDFVYRNNQMTKGNRIGSISDSIANIRGQRWLDSLYQGYNNVNNIDGLTDKEDIKKCKAQMEKILNYYKNADGSYTFSTNKFSKYGKDMTIAVGIARNKGKLTYKLESPNAGHLPLIKTTVRGSRKCMIRSKKPKPTNVNGNTKVLVQ